MKVELILIIIILVLVIIGLMGNTTVFNVDRICLRAGYITPRYIIKPISYGETHTVFNTIPTIYLRTSKDNLEQYDNDTIVMVLLHEIAHILCPSEGHTDEFDSIETQLLNSATELGYLDPNHEVDEYYPCRL